MALGGLIKGGLQGLARGASKAIGSGLSAGIASGVTSRTAKFIGPQQSVGQLPLSSIIAADTARGGYSQSASGARVERAFRATERAKDRAHELNLKGIDYRLGLQSLGIQAAQMQSQRFRDRLQLEHTQRSRDPSWWRAYRAVVGDENYEGTRETIGNIDWSRPFRPGNRTQTGRIRRFTPRRNR